jgi:hypothetical protein
LADLNGRYHLTDLKSDDLEMNPTNLATVPPELFEYIALDLDYSDLVRLCSSSTRLRQLCQSDSFWQSKYRHDFGKTLPTNVNARETYSRLVFTTIIHLVYQTYDVYLLYNSSTGTINTTLPNKIIHPGARYIEWHPTTRRTTPLVIAAKTHYQKNLGPGQVVGIVALAPEEIYSTIYKDRATKTGLAMDNELFYPNNSQIEQSILISREAGASVLEVIGNQIIIRDPLPYPAKPQMIKF